MAKMANRQAVLSICMVLVAVCYSTIDLEGECIPAEGYESCACYMKGVNNTREYVNLLPLKGNSSNPRFATVGDKGWYYLYSPCAEFNEFVGENGTGFTSCANASVARMTNLSAHQCDSLGDKASAKFTFKSVKNITDLIKSNLTLNFMSRDAKHYSAVISLVCDDSVAKNESILEYVGTTSVQADTYYLSLTSKCCCPGKCGIPPVPLVPLNSTTKAPITPTAAKQSGDKGLKTWQIVVIAAGGALLVLLIVGLVCCCRKRAGYQTI